MKTLILTPGAVTLDDLQDIYWNQSAVRLDPSSHPAIDRAHARIAKAVAGTEAVYGVNTGFGKLASVKIEAKDTATLQRNLILSLRGRSRDPPLPCTADDGVEAAKPRARGLRCTARGRNLA